MKDEKTLLFYGGSMMALLPTLLFIVIGIVLSIGCQFNSMKGLIFAGFVGLFIGFFTCKDKDRYWTAAMSGLTKPGNASLLFVFIAVGVFTKLLLVGKIGMGFVWLSMQLDLHGGAFVVLAFLAAAIVSMGSGAPIAALFSVIPIFYPPGILLGANGSVLIGALLSGVFLGDSLTPSSQVTLATASSQHSAITGEPGDVYKILKARTPYILAAALISGIMFYLFGGQGASISDSTNLDKFADLKGLWMLIPIIVLLLTCIKTQSLFRGLSYATIVGLIIGLLTSTFTVNDIISINGASISGIIFDGVYSMADIILATMLIFGLIEVMLQGGFIQMAGEWLMEKSLVKQPVVAELIIAGGMALVSFLLAGCELPSILVFSSMADTIGKNANLDPNRRAYIMMGMASNVTVISPINGIFIMGALTMANGLRKTYEFLPVADPYGIFLNSYFCLLTLAVCIIWVVFGIGRKVEGTEVNRHEVIVAK